jgi:subtilisin family serine protease
MRLSRRLWLAMSTGLMTVVFATSIGYPAASSHVVSATPAVVVAATPAAPAGSSDLGPTGVLPASKQWTVTLLTGEHVGVATDGHGRVRVGVQHATSPVQVLRKPNGDVYVLPTADAHLLAGGLDHELFNVTELVREGLDDASSHATPVIVQHAADDALVARADMAGGQPRRDLPSIDGTAIQVAKADTRSVKRLLDGLGAARTYRAAATGPRVWLDHRVETTAGMLVAPRSTATAVPMPARAPAPTVPLDWNLHRIGADRAWQRGIVGRGARVGVLDTGVDAQHPDLIGQVLAQKNFSESPDTVDRFGHGTHVAATIAGTGAAAPGVRQGVAPAAHLVIGKVLGDDGSGFDSQIIDGMEWAAPQADVINMSLGSAFPTDGSDPLSQAVDNLSKQYDTLFVLAAGNGGPVSQTLGTPAPASEALTVGATDRDDHLAAFSSRGPVVGTYHLKPEIVAPGVDIVAARAAGTLLGDPQNRLYTSLSGTSMATPHVAGAVALLVQQHPDWSAGQLKDALIGSADPIGEDGFDAGAGRVDIGSSVAEALRPDRAVIDVTLPRPRPAGHDEALSWSNTGERPLTIDLAVQLADRKGRALAAGTATVAPAHLTIAPHSTGTATLHINAPAVADGLYSGIVVATPEGAHTGTDERTPFSVHAEPRMVDLAITATPLSGVSQHPMAFFYVVTNLDDYAVFNTSWDVVLGTSTKVRVPVGRYSVLGSVFREFDFDHPVTAQVGDPDTTITDDTTVVFDGAHAIPFGPRVQGVATAPPASADVAVISTPVVGVGGQGVELFLETQPPGVPPLVAPMDGDPAVFTARQVFRLQAPPLTVRVNADPPLTDVSLLTDGPPRVSALAAADAGDGDDLSGTRGRLAVIHQPGLGDRAGITQRARDAGTAMLAFVDETQVPYVPMQAGAPWANEPVIAAGGASATALEAAAQAGATVNVTVTASPFAYDFVREGSRLEPTPVIGSAEQRQLARLDERFHRDPDGTGPTDDFQALVTSSFGFLVSAGPLPERRTTYMTPGAWQTGVEGPYWGRPFESSIFHFEPMMLGGRLSMDTGVTYKPGSRYRLTFLRRPQWPGAVADFFDDPFCPAGPIYRTADEAFVSVVRFQDAFGRVTCAQALPETLTVRQDGGVVGTRPYHAGVFPLRPGRSTLQISYEADAIAPYKQHTSTIWTFPTDQPADVKALLPLLTVAYDLPLDTLNRPVGHTGTLTARSMADGDRVQVRTMRVWTSTDHGATWHQARTARRSARSFDMLLPTVGRGTTVSLKIDAVDGHGSRIEQTLVDAYSK